MANLIRNLRFGVRLLVKNLGFPSVALLALTLGIGANTAIFSVVYAALLSPLPYPNPDQLVTVWSKVNGHNNTVPVGDYLDWRRQSSVFQDVVAWTGAVALMLAAIGIYGVMSFAVAQRTHEIGLRMALGAGPHQVLRLVLQEGMLLAFAGLVVGLAGTFFVGRAMKSILYEVTAIDPMAVSSVAAVLLLSALLACYIPARRAKQVDPMAALREE
jgi:hypothetical protein